MKFRKEEYDCWVADSVKISDSRPAIRIAVNSDDSGPSPVDIATIREMGTNIESLIVQAAELILRNYSYDHFKKLGVNEADLAEETPTAIAAVVTLRELYFRSIEDGEFEASFTAPWDPHHTFDIEHENHKPVCCAVNG